MGIQLRSKILSVGVLLCLSQAAAAQEFDVVDLQGTISGEPQLSANAARDSWNVACRDWKTETKGLNQNNQLLGINCNTPTCSSSDSGQIQCASTGTYQLKTAGVRVTNPGPQAMQPATPIVSAPPPPVVQIQQQPVTQVEYVNTQPDVVIETAPPPRIGFVWMPGFWGWAGHRHMWYHGYWRHWHR